MKKIFFIIIFLLFAQSISLGETFEDLQKIKKTSYLDFILLKIEQRLVQRHSLLGSQPMALRVQYQSVISQVDFSEKDFWNLKVLLWKFFKKKTPRVSWRFQA